MKLIRMISLTKGTLYSVTDFFYEGDARSFDIAHEESDITAGRVGSEFNQASVVGVLWVVMLVVVVIVSLILLPTGQGGHAFEDVLFEVASAQWNVGLSTGITGPNMPASVKLTFIGSMWVGRLEIIPAAMTARVLLAGFQ